MARRNFATPIEENIKVDFKAKCEEQGVPMNDVLEALMISYINDAEKVTVEKEVSYNYKVYRE
jgi:hypothetical protein